MAKISQKNKAYLVGVDEAGRGPLAGPVVACAVIIKGRREYLRELGIKDSKKMSAKKREAVYEKVKRCECVEWAVAVVSEKIIDEINIVNATKSAMKQAIGKVGEPFKKVVIDGNFVTDLNVPQEAVIKADSFVLECMLASVIAKITRDAIMREAHLSYPWYGFDEHKGYGTKKHYAALQEHGASPVHRHSFRLF